MSLPEQPEEILIEQLRYLPLQDLLNACQTNLRISQVCQGRRLWDLRLMDDFKVGDLSQISDSRSYYFSLLQERQNILNFILTNFTPQFFNVNSNFFSDYDMFSYQEFVNIQKDAVSRLTEEDINDVKVVQKLIPRLEYADFDAEHYFMVTTFFYYPISGVYRIVLTSIRE